MAHLYISIYNGGTISNNSAVGNNATDTTDTLSAEQGGGIFVKGSTLTLNDVAISGNTATADHALAQGGAIFVDAALNDKKGINLPATVNVNVSKDAAYTGNTVNGLTQSGDSYGSESTSAGGLLYLDRKSAANFNVADGATLTIGDANATDANADTIASSVVTNQANKSTVTKTGAGTMTVNSTLDGLHSDMTVEDGTLNVAKDWTTSNKVTVKDGATLNTQNLTLTKGPTTVNGSPIDAANQTAGALEADKGATVTAKDITANDGTTINAAQGSNLTADNVKVADGANVKLYGNANVTGLKDLDGNNLSADKVNEILGNTDIPASVKFGTDENTKGQLTADDNAMSFSFQTAGEGTATNTEVATLDKSGNLTTTGDVRDGKGNTLANVKATADEAKQAATEAKDSAKNYADAAAASATAAETAKTSAETAQTAAETAATNAAASAQTASEKANAAAASATAAKTSEDNAKASETAAAGSASAAKTSADNAAASATAADTSATNAANSASSAKTSETNAATSATAAKASEDNAKASETAAAASATTAKISEDNAVAAQTAAETAKTGAETAKTGAETAQTAAATSATNAATSEINAANSATAATNAQTAAETAQTGAEAARAAAEKFATDAQGSANSAISIAKDAKAAIGTTSDGNYVKSANTVGQNLNALDKGLASEAQTRAAADQALQDMISNSTSNLESKIDSVDEHNKKGIAGVAALAALHPLDFDPEAKWDFAAGYGNYRGENAAAIGAFYRPNEDVMFSVGGTIGDKDNNSVNAGVSIKLGHGSTYSSMSKSQLIQKVQDQQTKIDAQQAQIDAQQKQIDEILQKLAEK